MDTAPDFDLTAQLLALLEQTPAGFSEYQLLLRLREEHCPLVPPLPLRDPLQLFRTHFRLFNALYRLRDRLWHEGRGHLEIGPLLIRLQSYQAGAAALGSHDPLRAYYLDETQLRDTEAADVEQLLQSFWTRLHAGTERQAALELFGLGDAADYPAIRRRYRQLVSRHHPDRGGSTTRLQSINTAMEILERYYRSG